MLWRINALSKNGRGYKVSLPTVIVQALGWQVTDPIYIQVNPDDTLTMKKIERPEVKPTPAAPPT